jgi:Zn-dependent protease with chaperone function
MLKQSDWFAELRPFYRLCWVNWCLALAVLSTFVSNSFAPRDAVDSAGRTEAVIRGLPIAVIAAGLAISFLIVAASYGVWKHYHRRDGRLEALALAQTSRRLARTLSEWAACINAHLPDRTKAIVALAPGSASVMWTARSLSTAERPALVLVTPAFYSESRTEAETTAALVHEAGHVAAGDVETFKRLWSCTIALGLLMVPMSAIAVTRVLTGSGLSRVSSLTNFVMSVAMGIFAVASSWSALVAARELQADAFAAEAMGDSAHIAGFLQARARSRTSEESIGLRATIWRWLLQPDLTWRASLPALRGELGLRAEISVAVALAMLVVNGWWFAALVSRFKALNAALMPLFACALLYALALTFQFLWWRAAALVARRASIVKMVAVWLRLTVTIAIVVLAAASLLSATAKFGHPDGAEGVSATELLLFAFLVQIGLTLVAMWASISHLVDTLRSTKAPSVLGAVIGLGIAGASTAAAMLMTALGTPRGITAAWTLGIGGVAANVVVFSVLALMRRWVHRRSQA